MFMYNVVLQRYIKHKILSYKELVGIKVSKSLHGSNNNNKCK